MSTTQATSTVRTAPQTAEAVKHIDELMGTLDEDLKVLHMPIDLIIVSDHGMEKIQGLDRSRQVCAARRIDTVGDLYAPTEQAANATYQKLKAADAAFMVYRRANVPAELHFNSNAAGGRSHHRGARALRDSRPGADGSRGSSAQRRQSRFDPYMMPNMKAIFYAEGPDIRPGVKLKSFENVNVYPLIAKILAWMPRRWMAASACCRACSPHRRAASAREPGQPLR